MAPPGIFGRYRTLTPRLSQPLGWQCVWHKIWQAVALGGDDIEVACRNQD